MTNLAEVKENFYDHQRRYYEKLVERKDDCIHSIICIPTGGGKTRLAVVYLIENVIDRGKKVLWITHSKYLLNQAFSTFCDYLGSEWMRNNAMLIHSDKYYEYHDKTRKETISFPVSKSGDISSDKKLIITSFQSIKNNDNWQKTIGENVVIVVDEAHHVVAESYMDTIREYSNDKTVLGLTATPIRSKAQENNSLIDYFETDLGVKTHIATLFKENILVRPEFEDVEFEMDTSEITNIDELTRGILDQVSNYDQLIYERYENNKRIYGKTVIFAINKEHVDSLYDLFVKNGYENKVFKVYSGLSDREQQFEAFCDSEDGILINVNIMNEGVDIPDIKTIFMTKPLNSRITVTQIIGRALRKPRNKEKSIAHIVNFAVSNLGRKFLVVTPKLSYKIYNAEWEEGDEELDEIEMEERNLDSIADLVKEIVEKKASCSFSNICLAGHYTIIDGDGIDIPVPVSFVEYRKIEAYRAGKNAKMFPKKLFFCEDADMVKAYIDKAGTELFFSKYDEELFEKYEAVNKFADGLLDKVISEDLSEQQSKEEILKYYRNLREKEDSLLPYLSQIGVNKENYFVRLIRNELVRIKCERREMNRNDG